MTPPFRPSARLLFSVPAQLAAFALATLIVFWINADALFLRWDGTQHLTETAMQYRWGGPLLSLHLDPLRGNGEFSFFNNYRLHPAMAFGHWIGGDANARALAATLCVILYFMAIWAAFRLAGLGRLHAIAAAWAVCLAVLPYNVPPPTFIRAWGNMPLLPAFGFGLLSAAIWWRIGDASRPLWRDALDGLAIFALVAWVGLALPAILLMTGPAMAWFGLARFVGAAPVTRKRCLAVLVPLLLALAPIAFYVLELHAFTKSTVFHPEMDALKTGLRQASFLIYIHGEGSPLGEAIVWAAPFGALCVVAFVPGLARRFALTYLSLFAVIFGLAGLFEILDASWSGPPLAYIDLTLLPLHLAYAIAPAVLIVRAIWLMAARRPAIAHHLPAVATQAGLVSLALPFLLILPALWRVGSPAYLEHRPWPWPQARTELVALLEREIGLRGEAPFRGRLASLAGLRDGQIPFHAQHAFETELMHASGNDHRANGLWYFDIPTLSTSSYLTSPFFQAVVTRLLSDPGTVSIRAHLPIAKADARIMALYGTRYVLSEAPIPALGPASAFQLGAMRLFMHELADVNRGDYSAREAVRVPDARAALELLSNPEFDPHNRAIVHEEIGTPLSTARNALLRFTRDGAVFSAESDGTALVALPLSFTHCFDIAFESAGTAKPRALLANVSQTAILFEHDVRATLRLRLGPFENAGCRFADWSDMRRLRLDRVVGWWPQPPAGAR